MDRRQIPLIKVSHSAEDPGPSYVFPSCSTHDPNKKPTDNPNRVWDNESDQSPRPDNPDCDNSIKVLRNHRYSVVSPKLTEDDQPANAREF